MKVKALGEGFFKTKGALVGRRVKTGEIIELESLEQFSSKWMEAIDFDPEGGDLSEEKPKKKKPKPAPKAEPAPEVEPQPLMEQVAPQDEDVI